MPKKVLSFQKNVLIHRRWPSLSILFVLIFILSVCLFPSSWAAEIQSTEKEPYFSSESVFYAAGFGGNYVVIDEEHDLLIVVRWVGSTKTLDGIVQRVLASIQAD